MPLQPSMASHGWTAAAAPTAAAMLMLALAAGLAGEVAAAPVMRHDGKTAMLINAASVHTSWDDEDGAAESVCWGVDDGGVIRAVGTMSAVTAACPEATVVDAGGGHVLPGLADSHAHLMMEGFKMTNPQLDNATSANQVVQILTAHVKAHPLAAEEWLQGFGWDQNRFCPNDDCPFPTKAALDTAFPSTAVILTRIDGHAAWVNSAALRRVPPLPPNDPDGGHIVRDNSTGLPTGILTDKAINLVQDHVPWPTVDRQREALRVVLADCAANGLTGVTDPGVDPRYLALFAESIDAGNFTLRAYAMRNGISGGLGLAGSPSDPMIDDYGHLLSVKAVKFFMDGALGSWGAAMLRNYTDRPHQHGYFRIEPDDYRRNVSAWVEAGYQVATHAIGDAANRLVIDTYENATRAARARGVTADLRLRVEHAQITAVEDIPRFAANKLIPSMQPTHATSDMVFAEARLGPERLKGAYAWESFVKSNVTALAFGSDFPTVGVVPPLLGLHSAVTRQNATNSPPGGWTPNQRVSRTQALKGYTHDAAYASFQDHRVGTLAVGMYADMTILAEDYFTVNPERIWQMQVLRTLVGGRTTYQAPRAHPWNVQVRGT
mmetsp:Transcript_19323/g.57390  ORF Transcript_19323/g.57390 Transcript_19323/m.57390 type:complete len:606 (-) Transcript_19323:70-1887(-)